MWSLYLLPGRIIAELGFLWPGRNQYGATRRRRESRFAHFILATPFWIVFAMFGLPVLLGVAGSFLPNHHSTSTVPAHATESQVAEGDRSAGSIQPEHDATAAPTPIESRKPRPSIIFAPRQEVVQDTPTARTSYPRCSATVADQCVDR